MSFEKLVNDDIKELLSNIEKETENYTISFEYLGYDERYNKYYDGNYCNMVGTLLKIKNKLTGESLDVTLDLLKIPVPNELGYKLGKTNKQILKVDKRAPGWYIFKPKKFEDDESAKEKEILATMEYNSTFKKKLFFFCENNQIMFSTHKDGKDKVGIGELLKALTGKSYVELLNLVGSNKYTIASLMSKEQTTNFCIHRIASSLASRRVAENCDVSRLYADIVNRLFAEDVVGVDSAGYERYKSNTSYMKRAFNRELGKDLKTSTGVLKAGTKLTKEILGNIDEDESIESIFVKHNNKMYNLKKYRTEYNRLTVNEILTMVNMYSNCLDGMESYNDQYDTSSRIIVTYEDTVKNMIISNANSIISDVEEILENRSTMSDVDLRSTILELSHVNTDILIKELTSPENTYVQQSSNTNLLKMVMMSSKITADYKGKASADAINVQNFERNRKDPNAQPESSKIGKVGFGTIAAKIDKHGNIVTPYQRVDNGVVYPDLVYLSASEEGKYYIAAHDEDFSQDVVSCIVDGTVMDVPKHLVKFKESSPVQSMSVGIAFIPFPQCSNPKRLLMGNNHLSQGIYTLKAERPLVSTGSYSVTREGIITTKDILKEYYDLHKELLNMEEELFVNQSLKLVGSEIRKGLRSLTFKINNSTLPDSLVITKTFPFMLPTDVKSVFSNKLVSMPGNIYTPNDIVVHNGNVDIRQTEKLLCVDYGAIDIGNFEEDFALGVNLLVGFKTFEGSTIEDAITVKKSRAFDGSLTSVSIKEISMEIFTDNDTYEEHFGTDGAKTESHIQSNGLPVVGTYLKPGSTVMCKYKVYADGRRHTYEEKLDKNTAGEVISASIVGKEAVVTVASIDVAEIGDKLSGRFGNKGVIAKIVPDDDMPYLEETGEILDVCLNPLGIPSRMNISQLYEVALGRCAQLDGKTAVVSPYHKDAIEFVKEQRNIHGVKPQYLIDGRTGDKIARPVEVGIMYILKLEHVAKKKIAAVNVTGNLNPTTGQPQKGSGGQAVGEMETWVFGVEGCDKFLQDLLSMQSDDIASLEDLKKIIDDNPDEVEVEGENRNNLTIQAIMLSLGVNMTNKEDGSYIWEPLLDSEITKLSDVPLDTANTASLQDETVFGNVSNHKFGRHNNKARYGYIDLGCELVNPFWVTQSSLIRSIPVYMHSIKPAKISGSEPVVSCAFKTLGDKNIDDILRGNVYVGKELSTDGLCQIYSPTQAPAGAINGVEAMNFILKNTDLSCACNVMENDFDALDGDRQKLLDKYNILKTWLDEGKKLSDIIIRHYPIISPVYRPSLAGQNQIHDFDYYYRGLFAAIEAYKRNNSESAKFKIYESIYRFLGFGDVSNAQKAPLLKTYMGRQKDGKGTFRKNVLGKRVHFSGRSVIIPSRDTTMTIDHIGIPKIMAITIWELHLISKLSKQSPITNNIYGSEELDRSFYAKVLTTVASDNLFKFYETVKAAGYESNLNSCKQLFFDTCKFVIDYLNTRVGVLGRQPSLHKFASRAYKVRVTDGRAIELHPLVCKGYNADFDGDTTYFIASLTDSATKEVLTNLTPKKNIINPKDGSAVISHSQDMVLGVYYATMLYNNITLLEEDDRYKNIYSVGNLERLNTLLESDVINIQDLVSIKVEGRRYLSTAGRIIFNSLIPDGFTNETFTNVLDVKDVNKDLYCELRYDGLIASKLSKDADGKKVNKVGNVVYYSLEEITEGIHAHYDIDTTMNMFQDVMEFGFKYSDISGITLGIDDLELENTYTEDIAEKEKTEWETNLKTKYMDLYNSINAEEIGLSTEELQANINSMLNEEMERKTKVIESKLEIGKIEYYKEKYKEIAKDLNEATLNGLLSEEGRKEVLMDLAKRLSKLVEREMKNSLGRNNNLFIIKDSGARGNDNQLMQTLGMPGLTMKTLSTSFEVPILNSYAQGLTSFEMNIASYGARQGVASTQLNTGDAGYATRQMINMIGGISVKESDCGAYPIDLKLEYGEPHKIIYHYRKHKTNKVVDESNNIKYVNVLDDDGNEVWENDTEVFEGDANSLLPSLIGKTVVNLDDKGLLYLKQFDIIDNKLDSDNVKMIFKKKISKVYCSDGWFEVKYKLTPLFSSLLMNRYCESFPMVSYNGFINKNVIKHIEQENPEIAKVRLTFNCCTESGVCQTCYGLKYDTLQVPPIGDKVGVESAQAIGEPCAQLVLSLFHQGGKAGGSISGGVALNNRMLAGTLPKKDTKAVHMQESTYVTVNELGSNSVIEYNGMIIQVPTENIKVVNGEFVDIYETITEGLPSFNNLGTPEGSLILEKANESYIIVPGKKGSVVLNPKYNGDISALFEEDCKDRVIVAPNFKLKQKLTLTNAYFSNFKNSNITILARHFELLAKVQTDTVKLTNTNLEGRHAGILEEHSILQREMYESGDADKYILYPVKVAKQSDVVNLFSGSYAAMAFERALDQIDKVTSTRQTIQNKSILGKIFIGETMTKDERKSLKPVEAVKRVVKLFANDSVEKELAIAEDDIKMEELADMVGNIEIDLGGIDLTKDLDFNFNVNTEENLQEPKERGYNINEDTIEKEKTSKLDLFGHNG